MAQAKQIEYLLSSPRRGAGVLTTGTWAQTRKEDLQINGQALARKIPLFDRALTFLVLAILVELAGRVVQ
jgi:hypothetical protein